MRIGYSKEQVLHAFTEVSETSQNKEILLLWPAVLCRLREDQVYDLQSEPQTLRKDCQVKSTTFTNGNKLTLLNAINPPTVIKNADICLS